MSVRVLIVDDHAVVRSGLRRLLEAEEDIEVVGEAGAIREAVFETREEAGRDPPRRRPARGERDRGRAERVCPKAPR